jgi:hypothetical protein
MQSHDQGWYEVAVAKMLQLCIAVLEDRPTLVSPTPKSNLRSNDEDTHNMIGVLDDVTVTIRLHCAVTSPTDAAIETSNLTHDTWNTPANPIVTF